MEPRESLTTNQPHPGKMRSAAQFLFSVMPPTAFVSPYCHTIAPRNLWFWPIVSNAKAHLCPFNFSLSCYACFLPSSGTVHSVAALAAGSERGEFLLLTSDWVVWGWHLPRTLLFAYQQAEEQVKWDW